MSMTTYIMYPIFHHLSRCVHGTLLHTTLVKVVYSILRETKRQNVRKEVHQLVVGIRVNFFHQIYGWGDGTCIEV